MTLWPYLGWRRQTHRVRPYGFEKILEAHPGYLDSVLFEVAATGPLCAGDLPDPEGMPSLESDWYRRLPRAALEALFGFGKVAVVRRAADMARVFDLPERVLPPDVLGHELPHDEQRRELLLRGGPSARCGLCRLLG